MARTDHDSDCIDLTDPVDSLSISSVVHPECSVVGVPFHPDSIWFPSIDK